MTWYVFCSHSSTPVHVHRLTTVSHEGRMKREKERKRRTWHESSLGGERAREAIFPTYLCFAGYEKELTWPVVCTFRDLIDVCSTNSRNTIPPFVLPPGFLPSCPGSKLAFGAIIIPCRGAKN